MEDDNKHSLSITGGCFWIFVVAYSAIVFFAGVEFGIFMFAM